jgi:7-carboxy-7-deazaguanine synthase
MHVRNTEETDPRLTETLTLTEIYRSIQGESTWAGLPCTFVRFTGCNLRCTWCDTAYAFHDGEKTTVGEVLAKVEECGVPLVEITGGEPLLQKACPTLSACLLERGYTVLCETSGALPIAALPEGVVRIMDIKCPGSGESARNNWSNIEALTAMDEVKFVLADRGDYEWARAVVREHGLVQRCRAVLFSSAFGQASPRDIVEWILTDGLDVRFQLQMHKYIWAPESKGV